MSLAGSYTENGMPFAESTSRTMETDCSTSEIAVGDLEMPMMSRLGPSNLMPSQDCPWNSHPRSLNLTMRPSAGDLQIFPPVMRKNGAERATNTSLRSFISVSCITLDSHTRVVAGAKPVPCLRFLLHLHPRPGIIGGRSRATRASDSQKATPASSSGGARRLFNPGSRASLRLVAASIADRDCSQCRVSRKTDLDFSNNADCRNSTSLRKTRPSRGRHSPRVVCSDPYSQASAAACPQKPTGLVTGFLYPTPRGSRPSGCASWANTIYDGLPRRDASPVDEFESRIDRLFRNRHRANSASAVALNRRASLPKAAADALSHPLRDRCSTSRVD